MDEYQYLKERTEKRKRAQRSLEETIPSLQELLAGYGVELDDETWEMLHHTPITLACEEKRRLECKLRDVDRVFEQESLKHAAASVMPKIDLKYWRERTFFYYLPNGSIGIGSEGENYCDVKYRAGMMSEAAHALYRIILARKGIHTERAEGMGEWYDRAFSWQVSPKLSENNNEYLENVKDVFHWDYLYLQTRDRFSDPQAAAKWVARNVTGPERLEKFEKPVSEEKKEELFSTMEEDLTEWFESCSKEWKGAHVESSGVAWPILKAVSKRPYDGYRQVFDRMSMVAAKALIDEEVNHLSVETYLSTVISRIPHYLDEYLGE